MKKLNRRQFLALIAGSAATAFDLSGCRRPLAGDWDNVSKRPNILFIFSDQQHYQAVGFKDSFFDTTNLDRFAEESVVFDNCFCTTPQCSATRSSIMTGLYPHKTGVMGNIHHAGGNLLNRRTIAPLLQTAGYHTAYYGKWHLGKNKSAIKGWDQDYGVTKAIKSNAEMDKRVTEKAVAFLRSQAHLQKPFALFLSYNDPHDIYYYQDYKYAGEPGKTPLPRSWHQETFLNKPTPQKEFMTDDQGRVIWGKDKKHWQLYRQCYKSKVALYDNHVGEVLEKLKKQRLADNTIVIITSDHGDMDTSHHMIFKGPFMYEQLVRVPLMIRVPQRFGGIRPCRITDFDVVHVDFFPTLLDFCGIAPAQCDGISLKPILTGAKSQKKRPFVVGQYYGKQQWVTPIRMLRTAEFKYVKYLNDRNELYDLKNDPHELVNLADDPRYAAIENKLAAMLDNWIQTNDDPFYSLKPVPLEKGIRYERAWQIPYKKTSIR